MKSLLSRCISTGSNVSDDGDETNSDEVEKTDTSKYNAQFFFDPLRCRGILSLILELRSIQQRILILEKKINKKHQNISKMSLLLEDLKSKNITLKDQIGKIINSVEAIQRRLTHIQLNFSSTSHPFGLTLSS